MYELKVCDHYRANFNGSDRLFFACWRKYRKLLHGSIDDPQSDEDVLKWLNAFASEYVNDHNSPFWRKG